LVLGFKKVGKIPLYVCYGIAFPISALIGLLNQTVKQKYSLPFNPGFPKAITRDVYFFQSISFMTRANLYNIKLNFKE